MKYELKILKRHLFMMTYPFFVGTVVTLVGLLAIFTFPPFYRGVGILYLILGPLILLIWFIAGFRRYRGGYIIY